MLVLLLKRPYICFSGMAPLGIMRVNVFPTSSSGLPSSEVTFAEQTQKAGYTNGFFGMYAKGFSQFIDHLYYSLV